MDWVLPLVTGMLVVFTEEGYSRSKSSVYLGAFGLSTWTLAGMLFSWLGLSFNGSLLVGLLVAAIAIGLLRIVRR